MRLTRTGVGLLLGSIALVVIGVILGLAAIVAIGTAGLVAIVFGCVVVAEPPSISVARFASRSEVERGNPAEVTLEFRSTRTRRPRPFTAIENVAGQARTAALPALAAGHTMPLTYDVATVRRGNLVTGPLVLQRMDAFGLIKAQRRVGGTCTIAVRPRRHPISMLPSGRLRDLEGPTREVSKGTASFHQLREYVPGDDMRHIHWKSSARTGELVVKQLVDTTRPELVVIVDNRLMAVTEDDFEEVVDVAASILAAAEHDGFPTQLLFADGNNDIGADGVPMPHLERLTAVAMTDDDSLLQLADVLRARGRSLMFLTGELGSQDFRVVSQIAHGFSPAYLVSIVSDRMTPFITPPGITGIACSSSAEFATQWSGFR